MKIDKKESLYYVDKGDLVTCECYQCLVVENLKDSERKYSLVDVDTCEVIDVFDTLEQLREMPEIFLIAKAKDITLKIE